VIGSAPGRPAKRCPTPATFPTTCDLSMLVPKSNMGLNPFCPFVAAAAAVLLAATIGHADTTDDQFLALLSNDGVNAGPPDQMIAIAHKRCDANGLFRGSSFTLRYFGQPSPYVIAISKIATELQSRGLTGDQAVQFMRDAVTVYCPDTNG
jgi:hypothetical protein